MHQEMLYWKLEGEQGSPNPCLHGTFNLVGEMDKK